MILTSERTEEHTDMIRTRERTDVRTQWTKKGNWKKSDYSEPSRTWKKDDGKSGSKYQPKKKYPSKDDKHYSSKDEPKDHKDEPSKDDHETVDYDFKDDDGNYGTAYSSQLGGGVGARCTSRWQCDTQCCEGPYGQGRCVAKKIDWTNVFAYCPAECVGTIGGRQGTC